MKKLVLLFSLVLFNKMEARLWGKTGHQIIGEIAATHLTPKAKKTIDFLLDGKSLAEVSTFADALKSEARYDSIKAWHYINLPTHFSRDSLAFQKQPNVVTAIAHCQKILTDKQASAEEKAFFLKLLIHFVGDLHQPLHVGRFEDRGGNTIRLRWEGKKTNLHRLWDSQLLGAVLKRKASSFSMPKLSKAKLKKVQSTAVIDWVIESHGLVQNIYKEVEARKALSSDYTFRNEAIVMAQLHKAGVRLAVIMNQLFA